MKLMVKVAHREIIPRKYGLSYFECNTHFTVCHIIPLNFIAGWYRAISQRMRMGYRNEYDILKDKCADQDKLIGELYEEKFNREGHDEN